MLCQVPEDMGRARGDLEREAAVAASPRGVARGEAGAETRMATFLRSCMPVVMGTLQGSGGAAVAPVCQGAQVFVVLYLRGGWPQDNTHLQVVAVVAFLCCRNWTIGRCVLWQTVLSCACSTRQRWRRYNVLRVI